MAVPHLVKYYEDRDLAGSFDDKRRRTAERLDIDPEGFPRHVAIIMDGNGRWALNRGLRRYEGHVEGAKTVEKIAMYCVDIGVECLTLYSFSMQNWKRPAEEVEFLMYLYSRYLEEIRPKLMDNNVRLVHLGRTSRLPANVTGALAETVSMTGSNTGMALGLALNYGARAEITDAVIGIAREYKAGRLDLDDIDEACVSSHLYTTGLPDPDLLIRTSGELRISNFLLWQISYAEFYVTETLWPDFTTADLDAAVCAYSRRVRRFGDVKSETT
jgi:undecaprenyl diphosphate synthase